VLVGEFPNPPLSDKNYSWIAAQKLAATQEQFSSLYIKIKSKTKKFLV
jgi:hypothetical protein